MTALPSNPDELRALVRATVIAAIQRLEGAGGVTVSAGSRRELLVLFTGREAPSPTFAAQLGQVSAQGFQLAAAFSYSFKRFFSPEEILRQMPAGTRLLSSNCERELGSAATDAAGILLPGISPNTAAKLALALDDSVPTFLLTKLLLAGKPVIVGRPLEELGRVLAEANPALAPAFQRTAENHFHKLQQMGVTFSAPDRLAAAVQAAFHVPVNETPARLARTRPNPKREFVTAEDVWRAHQRGEKTLVHARTAIVTDQAREFAASHGVELRED